MNMIKVPLRLDIAGSYTDLPGYREKGGMHIATPLDYTVMIYAISNTRHHLLPVDDFFDEMNHRVAWLLGNHPMNLNSLCSLEQGAGLGGSSATVVGLVQWYTQAQMGITPHKPVKPPPTPPRGGKEGVGELTSPSPLIKGGRGVVRAVVNSPLKIAQLACQVIEQKGICGRQDEFCAIYARPVYLYYNNNETEVQTFEWPEEFRRNIEGWNLLYIPRTTSCQEMLEYEMNANLDIEPIVYFTKLMFKAIQQADWDEFWKWYMAHWKFIEEQNPHKINDEIRELRKQYAGIYIRPCGAGAGGYLLIHGNIEGENTIPVRITNHELRNEFFLSILTISCAFDTHSESSCQTHKHNFLCV